MFICDPHMNQSIGSVVISANIVSFHLLLCGLPPVELQAVVGERPDLLAVSVVADADDGDPARTQGRARKRAA